MRVLAACEESQAVTIELRALGHEAYSCDLVECSGGHPEWHIQCDAIQLLKMRWDMIIAFPPCTYMTRASAVRMRVKGEIQSERYEKAMAAKEFFLRFYNTDCPRICIENPTPMRLVGLPPCSQVIQPWQFGHPYTKRTCLWLKGLPPLMYTEIVAADQITPWVNGGCKDSRGNYRRFQGRNERDPRARSKTFPGIAKAMAQQWAGERTST